MAVLSSNIGGFSVNIGYMYDMEIVPPRGGNHVHALELVNGFLASEHMVSVVGDSTVPGVINYTESKADLDDFLSKIDVLYVRIDGRSTRRWTSLTYCVEKKDFHVPLVIELNAPANEGLAFSYLGGINSSSPKSEGFLKKIKRSIHAYKKYPDILLEERHRLNLFKSVDTAICVSHSLAKYARDKLRICDVVVLPNGGPLIDKKYIDDASHRTSSSKFTVLYSGSAIYPWQGLNYLLPTIALAAEKAPDIQFVLAVNQMVDSLPEAKNVTIKVGLDREQILKEICQADLGVALHPEYFWSKWKFHGSPMKMFEYMACSTPVLASDLGQMKELLSDGYDALLCANDPEKILEKIIFARDNPAQLKKIAESGRSRVQSELSWANNVKVTIGKFSSLTSAKASAREA